MMGYIDSIAWECVLYMCGVVDCATIETGTVVGGIIAGMKPNFGFGVLDDATLE